jgi:hypothetical protein
MEPSTLTTPASGLFLLLLLATDPENFESQLVRGKTQSNAHAATSATFERQFVKPFKIIDDPMCFPAITGSEPRPNPLASSISPIKLAN